MVKQQRSRRPRDRDATERELLEATRRRIYEDGVLAGLNLNTVAREAGANRGAIYQYFGSRQGLLRAALSDMSGVPLEAIGAERDQPFAQRRTAMFEAALTHMPYIRLQALLALDDVEELQPLSDLEHNLSALEREAADGVIPPDVDAVALHVITAAVMHGYAVFRDYYSAQLGIPADDLDHRVATSLRDVLDAVTGPETDTKS